MRPYLAVIKDSFREALASRVLWILLVLITLLLLGLAPLGLKEQRATFIRVGAVFDWPALIGKLKARAAGSENSPGKRIWGLLKEDLKSRLDALPTNPTYEQVTPELTTSVVEELNRLLGDRDLYDDATWSGVTLDKEAKELLDFGVSKLAEDDVSRLNRLLLEASFPEEIAHSSRREIHLAYFRWVTDDPIPFPQSQVKSLVKGVLAGFMNFFLGTLAVLGAILVTAPIIPHTYEAGAIDLLLSKPVSRSLLFLAKFLGGCSFILVNVSYFIAGLWLILGLRFDLWSGKLLMCIPIFLFLFAIYYSVSALAGVVWRNAIVSVVVTVLFWGACFVVKTTKNVIEQIFLNPDRIVKLVPAGESLFGVNEQGEVQQWRADERKWAQVLQEEDESRGPFGIVLPMFGPVHDRQNDRLLAIKTSWSSGFRFTSPDAILLVGNRADGWTRNVGPVPPKDPVGMFVNPEGEAVIVTRQGIHRVHGDLQSKQREFKLLGLRVPLGGKTTPYAAMGPEPPLRLSAPYAAAMNSDSGALAVWSRGTLTLMERNEDGKYRRVQEKQFEGNNNAAVLAFAGSTLLVALADGHVWLMDPTDLSVRQDIQPEGNNQPRFAEAAPGGRWFAVVFHHHELWLFDATSGQAARHKFIGRGDISSAVFADAHRLLLVDHGTRVTEYELDPFRVVTRHVPDMGVLERVYRYGVLPVYTVFPKPGELDNMVAYLLTDKETTRAGPDAEDLTSTQVKLNIRGPVWSSLAFMAVVLGLTCLYIRRTDF